LCITYLEKRKGTSWLPEITPELKKACSIQVLANPTLRDYSGVDLLTTSVQPSRLGAIFLLAARGEIPEHKKG